MKQPSFGVMHWLGRPMTWLLIGGLGSLFLTIEKPIGFPYVENSALEASLSWFLLVPALTAASAWEASRFSSYLTASKSSASNSDVALPAKILADRILPWSLTIPLGYSIALIYVGVWPSDFSAPTPWFLLAYSLLLGLIWSTFGAIFGALVHPLVSVTVSGLFSYGWFAVLPATHWTNLRHMTGDLNGCCSVDTVLDRNVVYSGALSSFALVLLFIAIWIAWQRNMTHWPIITGVAVAISAAAIVGSANLSSEVPDYKAYALRDLAEIECTDTVCHWPEWPQEYVDRNREAYLRFKELAPQEWQDLTAQPIATGSEPEQEIQNRLFFSGAETLEDALGNFVDQAASRDLRHGSFPMPNDCQINQSETILTYQPWDPNTPIDSEVARHRVVANLCPAPPL